MFTITWISQEIYSIKLPGNPKLGEGKPENQNHAIVFTRGNAIQTVDMNQVTNCFFRVSMFLCCVPLLEIFGLMLRNSYFAGVDYWFT